MSIAYESDTDLGFDTAVFRGAATEYGNYATDLRNNAKELKSLVDNLYNKGWTTNAGKAFHDLVEDDWILELDKYAELLENFRDILNKAVTQYELLMNSNVNTTKI